MYTNLTYVMMSSSIDPNNAERLLMEGGILLFLDVPPRTEFGIDLYSWNTGERFMGLKMIPPGLHFIYYSAVSKDGQTAPRTGFFHTFKRQEILVKKWDKRLEDIQECAVTDTEVEQFRSNIRNLDRFLGPYPYDVWKDWISLTNHMSDAVLDEVLPLNQKISSASELVPDLQTSKQHRQSRDAEELLPKMCLKPGTEIRFTKFPDLCHPEGCSASEISKHNMDLSFTFQTMLQRYTTHDEFLGEFQMAFVCFVIGQVYDAFEHWKQLLHLVCSCDDALVTHHQFFSKFITNLHFQLNQIPKDFFVDIVSRSNFLTTTLQVFFSNLKNSDAPKQLVDKGQRFCSYLTKKFKWDFDAEPEEDAPVVVEL